MIFKTLRPEQSLVLDTPAGPVVVKHLGFKRIGGKIRAVLGITAPDHVRVDRREVYLERLAEGGGTTA